MLTHHSGQDYNVAASEAAASAREKFDAIINRGKERALNVIEQINTQVPNDRIVSGAKLQFKAVGNEIKISIPEHGGGEVEEGFHRHAIGQAAAKADMPLGFVDKLAERGEWGAELVAHNFNQIYGHGGKAKFLTRSVNNEVRGFLSDTYRRLDARPIADQFIAAMGAFNAVPVDGFALDTKIALKAVLPYIFEPVPNEVMIFGVALETSDFGDGALSMRSFVERLWCTNRAISTEDLRKIHLGARLGENLQLSQKTYDLDTQTMASAAYDIVTRSLGSGHVNEYMETIKAANAQKIDASRMSAFLKANLRKEEAAAVLEAFNSPDVENLPPGNTAWRFSNAISWIANSTAKMEDGRKLEVMKVAGQVLDQKIQFAQAA